MKAHIIYFLFCLITLSSCKSLYSDSAYKGNYSDKIIIINFISSKKGYLKIDKQDSIPFKYSIEKVNVEIKNSNQVYRNIKHYVYRFNVNAQYNTEKFPFGLYEIGQKRGMVLRLNDSITFVKQEINK